MIKFIKLHLLILVLFSSSMVSSAPSDAQNELLKQLPPDQREAMMKKMNKANKLNEDIEEAFDDDHGLVERQDLVETEKCDDCIYGYSLFRFSPSTFAPANQIPMSSTYALGPGDHLEILLFGNEQAKGKAYISREGTLDIPLLGPITLAGLTFNAAVDLLNQKIEKEFIGTKISLSLTKLRSITIYVLGEAYMPGSYTVSGLSSVTNALFVSGGVKKTGSLREIAIKRNGKIVHNYDFYNLIINGDTTSAFRLEDGDTIFIPFIENKVTMGGAFKRPFLYEFIEGDTLEEAIALAGGFKSEARINPRIEISTLDTKLGGRSIFNLSGEDRDLSFKLSDGDVINVSGYSQYSSKVIEITGEVINPGFYSLAEGDTVLDALNKAGGFTASSYSEGAVFLREQVAEQQRLAFNRSADSLEKTMVNIISQGFMKEIGEYTLAPIAALVKKLRNQEPIGRQVVDFDILKLKSDPYANFKVRDGDSIFIPKRPESVSVVGEVLNPATLRYRPGSNVSEYIKFAGGLNDQADKGGILVIFPNGEAKVIKRRFFSRDSEILPGSTIVVSRHTRSFDAIAITQIVTPILADLATSAAAIAAFSDRDRN